VQAKQARSTSDTVLAFDSESTEGAGGALQLESTIVNRARKLAVRLV
jgi:hypothetical protein